MCSWTAFNCQILSLKTPSLFSHDYIYIYLCKHQLGNIFKWAVWHNWPNAICGKDGFLAHYTKFFCQIEFHTYFLSKVVGCYEIHIYEIHIGNVFWMNAFCMGFKVWILHETLCRLYMTLAWTLPLCDLCMKTEKLNIHLHTHIHTHKHTHIHTHTYTHTQTYIYTYIYNIIYINIYIVCMELPCVWRLQGLWVFHLSRLGLYVSTFWNQNRR